MRSNTIVPRLEQARAPTLYLLGYNLMFVMPLIALMILFYRVTSLPLLREEIEKRKYLLRSVSAVLLLALGVLLVLRHVR